MSYEEDIREAEQSRAACELLARVENAIRAWQMPFDLVVAWEEQGEQAWFWCRSLKQHLRLLLSASQPSPSARHDSNALLASLALAEDLVQDIRLFHQSTPDKQRVLQQIQRGIEQYRAALQSNARVRSTTSNALRKLYIETHPLKGVSAVAAAVDSVSPSQLKHTLSFEALWLLDGIAEHLSVAKFQLEHDTDAAPPGHFVPVGWVASKVRAPTTDELILAAARDT